MDATARPNIKGATPVSGTKGAQNEVTIIVNTRPRSVRRGVITFDEVVALALDPVPTGPYIQITVTYFRAEGGKSGDLVPGDKIAVHAGMIFDVTATDLS